MKNSIIKNQEKMKRLIFIFLTFFAFISCSKDDDSIPNSIITVTLQSNVTGTLSNSPTIQYRDSSGVLQSEILPIGAWKKSLNVSSGFNLLVKTKGTLNGNIQLTVSASGSGVSFNDHRDLNSNFDRNFNLEISTTL